MIRRAAQGAAVLLMSLTLVTACSSSNRPEDLTLSEAKPCRLILHSRFQALNVTRGPTPIDSLVGDAVLDGSSCEYSVRHEKRRSPISIYTNNIVTLSVITNHGVEWKIDEASNDDDSKYKDVRRIQGYRAVKVWSVSLTAHPPGPNSPCILYVDVTDEQMLRTKVASSHGQADPPTCETARQFANTALDTLRTRQG